MSASSEKLKEVISKKGGRIGCISSCLGVRGRRKRLRKPRKAE